MTRTQAAEIVTDIEVFVRHNFGEEIDHNGLKMLVEGMIEEKVKEYLKKTLQPLSIQELKTVSSVIPTELKPSEKKKPTTGVH